ncbi:MAG: hypothetical protein N2C14_28615 [Planctomycetales bacterium]
MTSLEDYPPDHDAERPSHEQSIRTSDSSNDRQGTPTRSLASLVADGELPIPVDWPADRLRPLLREVHELRRRRLVALIARAIASDLRREERQENFDVEK